MDAKTVRETVIKPKLIGMFGNSIASSLLTRATTAGMRGNTEQEKLKLMIEAICSDQRVVGMWGATQTARQKTEWLKLLP